ncbi:hypothetical protein WDV93_26420 [Pantoea ananatis]
MGQKLHEVQSVTLRFSLSVAGDRALPKQVSCDVSKSASAVHDKKASIGTARCGDDCSHRLQEKAGFAEQYRAAVAPREVYAKLSGEGV